MLLCLEIYLFWLVSVVWLNIFYSNLIRSKLLNQSERIIVYDSQKLWTRTERLRFKSMDRLDVPLGRTFLYNKYQQIVSMWIYVQ